MLDIVDTRRERTKKGASVTQGEEKDVEFDRRVIFLWIQKSKKARDTRST